MLEPLCKARYLDRSPAPVPRRIERAPYVTAPDVGTIVVDAVRGNASPSNIVMSARSLLRIAYSSISPCGFGPSSPKDRRCLASVAQGPRPARGYLSTKTRGRDGSSDLRAPRRTSSWFTTANPTSYPRSACHPAGDLVLIGKAILDELLESFARTIRAVERDNNRAGGVLWTCIDAIMRTGARSHDCPSVPH